MSRNALAGVVEIGAIRIHLLNKAIARFVDASNLRLNSTCAESDLVCPLARKPFFRLGRSCP